MLQAKSVAHVGPLDLASGEHARLVRLCARLSGDAGAAEDLAQETLLEAWRHRHRLVEPAGRAAWLAAIARNVCRRWSRARGRDRARLVPLDVSGPDDPDAAPSFVERLADDADGIEVELEREELADLLDRALALLPPETRDVLVARYVHESPHAEVAARLGLSQVAVAKRIQRGRLALRRALSTDLRVEAAAYGIINGIAPTAADAAEATRIWCPECGRRRLTCRINRATGKAVFTCADCSSEPGVHVSATDVPALLDGVTSFKSILSRQMDWIGEHARRALADGTTRCPRCGRPLPVRIYGPEDAPDFLPVTLRDQHNMIALCARCDHGTVQTLRCLVLDLPAGQRFWRDHGRIRMLPERAIEYAGRPAVLGGLESLGGTARLEIVSARETFEVLESRVAPPTP
ncbi:MAG TPA: RNA polymerase sigma factor [Ktedonobacterales bacterium]|jgi:RNA polymerase sigma-70 factor (ECF subfamily)